MSSRVSQKGPGLKAMRKALRGSAVTVGLHEQEGSAAKTESDRGESLVEVMTKHELGIGVPNRSFLGAWFDGNEPNLKIALDRIAKAAVENHRPVEQALARFGVWAVGSIQQRVADGIAPELSERRKAEKAKANLAGNAKDTPLIFTGQFRSSLTSKVEAR
jgi:hypothetical protein